MAERFELKIISPDEVLTVSGGFVEILQEKITVLAEGVQWTEKVSV